MRIRGFVALAAAGMLLAACGSSSKSASDPTTPTTIEIAPSTPKQLAADKATAQAAVLKLSDLTAGYKQTPPDPGSNDPTPPAVLAQFATCAHISKSDAATLFNDDHSPKQPKAKSSFKKAESDVLETDLESDVELDRSAKDISKPFAAVLKIPLTCWQGYFEAALTQTPTKGVTFGAVKVTPLATTGLGDQALAFRASLTLSGGSIALPMAVDLYFVGHGRAGVTLEATGVGRPADPSFERSLVEKVVARLDAAS